MSEDSHTLPGPGGLLRAARESASISLRDISAQLHLDERTIDSLERDDFENLPAPTFVRGYLRGYARLLSVPVGPVMEAYDREGFRPPDLVADISEAPESNATDFPVSLVTWAVALVLGAMVIVWWNNNTPEFGTLLGPMVIEGTAQSEPADANDSTFDVRNEDPPLTAEQEQAANESPPLTTDDGLPPALTAVQSELPTPSMTSASADAQADSATAADQPGAGEASPGADKILAQAREVLTQSRQITGTPTPGEQEQLQNTPATASEVAAQSNDAAAEPGQNTAARDASSMDSTTPAALPEDNNPAQPTAPGKAHLELEFAVETWVEIFDRDNKKLFYNLAKPGQTVDLRGAAPLRVLLGRTRGLQIRFNEEPFDVAPFVEKGVARFTLP